MKRIILTAFAAAALFAAPVLPVASAGEYGYRDRGDRYERRDDRRDRYEDREDRHDHDRHHEERYVVHYHLDGGDREVLVKSHDRAHRTVEFLRSVGARAHLDGRRVVHYRMRGEAKIVRYSHADAHRLAEKLEGYGFHAHVDHE
jgi:Ni/Co efflux regulator RcnB